MNFCLGVRLLCLVVIFPLTAAQGSFRVTDWAPANSLEALHSKDGPSLLAEIEEELGGEHRKGTESRTVPLESQLRSTFLAMPKNEYGNLGHATVRYALHRFFVGVYGWSVRGLDIAGGAWNGSSPIDLLRGQVPVDVQAIFERRLGGRGLDLHDLAVFAGTLVHLVHIKSTRKLEALYTAQGFDDNATIHGSQVDELLAAYFAGHLLSVDFLDSDLPPLHELLNFEVLSDLYPHWSRTLDFVHKIRLETKPRADGRFSFNDVATALEKAQTHWGPTTQDECVGMKHKLMEMEDGRSGCVRLSSFYDALLHKGMWQFNESPEYLRKSGLLDESDKSNPRLIIANYVNAPGNCLAHFGLYSVCCLNECEQLLGHLEDKLQAPDATPAEIAKVVAALPSASEPANRKLSAFLLGHLDEVAQRHGGRVPLHGRLFSQLMHFAYPRECPFPRISGSTTPFEPWDFEDRTGQSVGISAKLAHQIAKRSGESDSADLTNGTCALWDNAEELYVHFKQPSVVTLASLETDASVWAAARNSAMLAVLACSLLLLARFCQTAARSVRGSGPKRSEVASNRAIQV